jgi:hypothetical protein
MSFASARFVGDAFLQQIYDDPDTGGVKLGPGDTHTSSVLLVQQALVDLGWPERANPPVTENIAIGTFGPLTTRVVLTYKRHYGIVFPPESPTGFIDEFVGPRTLRKLDVQIAFWDESAVAIAAKIELLRLGGMVIDIPSPRQTVLLGHNSILRKVNVDNGIGGIFNTFDIGCFEVHGPIFEHFWSRMDLFGMPTSDQYENDAGHQQSDFRNGSITYDPISGEVSPSLADGPRHPQL